MSECLGATATGSYRDVVVALHHHHSTLEGTATNVVPPVPPDWWHLRPVGNDAPAEHVRAKRRGRGDQTIAALQRAADDVDTAHDLAKGPA